MRCLSAIIIYLGLSIFLGIYGFFYASFYPEPNVRNISLYASFVFFILLSTISIWAFVRHKSKLMPKFKRPAYYYVYALVSIPALSAFMGVIHYAALSKGIPSLYNLSTVEKVLVESKITGKRLWGKNDRHEEVFISGFDEGFPVGKRYYHSVQVGQVIKIGIRKSKLGTKIEFLQP